MSSALPGFSYNRRVTEDAFTAEERRWLAVWDEKRQQIATGAMSAADVREWVWQNKVLNAINVTIQRIKRSHQPGRDIRRTDNTWVTVAAERGRSLVQDGPRGRIGDPRVRHPREL